MDKIYIFGHQRPDTDAITGAITLSYLKNKLGMDTEPRALGHVNDETKYVLDYFKVKEPKYLNDVRLQIKDIDYHKDYFLDEKTPIKEVYDYFIEKGITGVPIVDKNQLFLGIVTLKDIAKEIINGNINKLDSTYDNIVKTLEGEEVLKFDDNIDGNLIVASYKSQTFFNNIALTNQDILLVGDRHQIHEYAIKAQVKLLIVTGNLDIDEEHIELAKKNKVNIIKTKFDTFNSSKKIGLSNEIRTILHENSISFKETDFYDDFVEETKKLKHNNYPVVDANGKCLGLIRITDINEKNNKKVILVDHQEFEQSAPGIEEAEIVEIVDHHKISNISTKLPINFRNMAVGSSNTIIHEMYKENGIKIPDDMAGLMISGILSDTLILQSPTTTQLDREVVEELAKQLKIDYKEYAINMFKAGTSLKGKTKEEIITTDLKTFTSNETKFAVAQIFTLDVDSINEEIDDYISELERINESLGCKFTMMCITDVIKNGSYVLYTSECKDILESGFKVSPFDQMTYIDGLASRKKQMVPVILSELEK
ncbi:MAG: putative manganese-dependent inorganic diphosphatase [Bacilli bacterium]|nr:putative manganese-dependent inorganic diphosphatase [Bacilli bacterium]